VNNISCSVGEFSMDLSSLVYASQTLPYCKELPRSRLPHTYQEFRTKILTPGMTES